MHCQSSQTSGVGLALVEMIKNEEGITAPVMYVQVIQLTAAISAKELIETFKQMPKLLLSWFLLPLCEGALLWMPSAV